jgi:hypothetical protein
MAYDSWREDYHMKSTVNMLLLATGSFAKRELAILMYLAVHQPAPGRRRITITEIAKSIGYEQQWSRLSSAIRRLADASLIVNIGSEDAPNLAVNPQLGLWRMDLLAERRAADRKRRK